MEEKLVRNTRIFNTPLEAGLRCLVILTELDSVRGMDLHTIVVLDYLLIHSGDVENGPPSLHAEIPLRSSSISLTRKLIESGLDLMVSRDLILKKHSTEFGVTYSASDLARSFLGYFETSYYKSLAQRSKWLKTRFENLTANDINRYFTENIEKWSSEFSRESFERLTE